MLGVRFTAANNNLERMSGVLGLKTVLGCAADLVKGTLEVLAHFATPGHGRPNPSSRTVAKKPAKDDAFYKKLLNKTEYFNADCDGAEQLAGKIMSQKAKTDLIASELPRLRVVSWDVAHGFRRITSRPWKVDPYMKETFAMFITNKKSVVRMVQNSSEFQSWFDRAKTELDTVVGKKVCNFSFKGHRMDSTSRPLARAVLNCFAIVKVASQIAAVRKNLDEGKAAEEFLQKVDAERNVMLAMMADAGADSLELTRFVDSESCAAEDVMWEVDMFLHKITMLYVDGAVEGNNTYTEWALAMLRHPVLVFANKEAKMIGMSSGVPRNTIARCLGRMCCWVKLAKAVAETEFPEFRAVVAFRVFSLTSGNERGRGCQPGRVMESLENWPSFLRKTRRTWSSSSTSCSLLRSM